MAINPGGPMVRPGGINPGLVRAMQLAAQQLGRREASGQRLGGPGPGDANVLRGQQELANAYGQQGQGRVPPDRSGQFGHGYVLGTGPGGGETGHAYGDGGGVTGHAFGGGEFGHAGRETNRALRHLARLAAGMGPRNQF